MSNYLNSIYPRSNKIDGVHYLILIEGQGIHRADTFEDMETIVYQTKWHSQSVKKAIIMNRGLPCEFIPETHQERFDREEGRERCERIAEEINAYHNGNMYRCPECGEIVEMTNDVGDKFRCYHCHETNEVNDFEQLSIYDYLDDILDIDFTVNRYKEYQSCSICIGWGGPNIYIDTDDAYIKLYWGSTREQYPIRYETRDEIDEWAQEYYDNI